MSAPGEDVNTAFVFLKPHAVTNAADKLLRDHFSTNLENSIIVSDGTLAAMDLGPIIDQHYGTLSRRAMLLHPREIPEPKESVLADFVETFGMTWHEALEKNTLVNIAGCQKIMPGMKDANLLEARWRSGKCVKLMPGTYVARVSCDDSAQSLLVVNGFYASMREKFTSEQHAPDGVRYYVVQWPEESCSWSRFRNELVGATKISAASPNSLRGKIFASWKQLGMKESPAGANNGVHASMSAIESLYERMLWLGAEMSSDPFAKKAFRMGLPSSVLREVCNDEATLEIDGEKVAVFDALELLGSTACIDKLLKSVRPPESKETD